MTQADGRKDPPAFGEAFRQELEELLAWRRDVRRFRTDPVAEADMLDLLRLACLAPSVGNAQPWRFVRVRSAELRASLARHVDLENQLAAAAYDDEAAAAYAALKLHGLREAPELLAVFADEHPEAGRGLGRRTMPETLCYSTVLAIHTLWLAARARGIGIGWVSILDPATVAALLRVEPSWRLVGLLCVGYPQAQDDVPELARQGWQARLDWTLFVSER
ncbi:5,6-dimethylbenzimidazole synthase [Geminicoccus roseus]|uniref:5,6-dimethylbenzimidazole synthase n=1 Tax=Geminicoccus roseus TaxID=404900 RepID=UPI0004275848|nr:5,6-dimethylbenzimidazole synthase [Geminicoccus roseus]